MQVAVGRSGICQLRNLATNEVFKLGQTDRFFIGRARDCAIVLRHDAVARRHVLIEPLGAPECRGFRARHIGSANSPLLDGVAFQLTSLRREVMGSVELRPGDVIRIVDAASFMFEGDVSAAMFRSEAHQADPVPTLQALVTALEHEANQAAPQALVNTGCWSDLPDVSNRQNLRRAYVEAEASLKLRGELGLGPKAAARSGRAALDALDTLASGDTTAALERLALDLDEAWAAPPLYFQAVALLSRLDPERAGELLYERAHAGLSGIGFAPPYGALLVATRSERWVAALVRDAKKIINESDVERERWTAAAMLAEMAQAPEVSAVMSLVDLLEHGVSDDLRLEAARGLAGALLGAESRPLSPEIVETAERALRGSLQDRNPAVVYAASRPWTSRQDPFFLGLLRSAAASIPPDDLERRALFRRIFEDVAGMARGAELAAWLRD